MKKEEKRRARNRYTTLYEQNQQEDTTKRRIGVTYHKDAIEVLNRKLKGTNMKMAASSRAYQLKSVLGTTKDKKKLDEKSGVYRIECRECGIAYIGQTKRLIKTRFHEHIREAEN